MKLKDPIDYDRYSCFFGLIVLHRKIYILLSLKIFIIVVQLKKKKTNVYLYSDLL